MHWTRSTYATAIASTAFVGLLSLSAIALLIRRKDLLQRVVKTLIGLAAGALLGNALFHLFPEIFRHGWKPSVVAAVLGGVVMFLVIEKVLSLAELQGRDPHGYVVLIGDISHNVIDGMLIGAAFYAGTGLGLATTVAIVLHEIPHELGVFGVLLNSGFSVRLAFLLNVGIAAAAVGGTVVSAFFVERIQEFSTIALGITAGGFLYIAAAELLPKIYHERDKGVRTQQWLALAAGLLVMLWRE